MNEKWNVYFNLVYDNIKGMCLQLFKASKLAKCDAWEAWKDRGKFSHRNISCYSFVHEGKVFD